MILNGEWIGIMFDKDRGNGIAAVLLAFDNGTIPTERSEDDPNQGWDSKTEAYGSKAGKVMEAVKEPYHRVY